MLAPRFRLTASHQDDLATICRLGPGPLIGLAAKIEAEHFTIRRGQIERIIQSELGSEQGGAVTRVLFGIAASFRRMFTSPSDALERLTETLMGNSSSDGRFHNWSEVRPALERLLETQSLVLSAKALDISYDFERIFLVGRILTSLRPVFDELRVDIQGATIVQTLRLEYVAPNGEQSNLSFAMDVDDIRQLQLECERALKKAEVTKARIEKECGFEAIIPGEETSD